MDKQYFGYFDSATRNKFALATSAGITPSDPEVVYWVSPKLASKIRSRYACTPGEGRSSTVHARDVAQVAYLDVGRWGGGGAWKPQRSFGIAAGRSVFYCSYRKPAQKGGPVWTAATHSMGAMPDGIAITPLLNKLSSSSRLGSVFVEEATYNQIPCIVPGEKWIYVFLGDLHLPLLTEAKDIGLGAPPTDSECMEFGRLDMKNPVVMGLAAAGLFLNPRNNEKLGIKMLSPEVPFVEVDEHADLNDNKMSMSRAKTWYDTFRFYDSSTLGADIFEPEAGAAQDLIDWLDLLQQAINDKPGGRTVVVWQLGDLFELWVGMRNAVHAPFDVQHRLLQFWIHHAENETHPLQRKAIAMLRATCAKGGGILAGNHDDYFSTTAAAPQAHDGRGIWAEHGHQNDDFNKMAYNKSTGRYNRDTGWLITQIASAQPNLRAVEDPLSGFVAWALNPIYMALYKKAPRLEFMERALNRCVIKTTDPKSSYAMGHTHHPCAKRICIRVGDPDGMGK